MIVEERLQTLEAHEGYEGGTWRQAKPHNQGSPRKALLDPTYDSREQEQVPHVIMVLCILSISSVIISLTNFLTLQSF